MESPTSLKALEASAGSARQQDPQAQLLNFFKSASPEELSDQLGEQIQQLRQDKTQESKALV